MSGLADWLLEQIAADEEGAILARDGDDWHGRDQCDTCDATWAARDEYGSPARVLAECAAKRAIVERYANTTFDFWAEPDREYENWILPLLALSYAGRAGYQDDWRPGAR